MTTPWNTTAATGDAIPGHRPPAAYGLGLRGPDGFDWARVNTDDPALPGAVLAKACGHRAGDASYTLDADALDRAVEMLAAEEGAAPEAPDLARWRALRTALEPGDEAVAVFTDDLTAGGGDAYVRRLRAEVLAGREENADGTTTLWRPVNAAERDLLAAADWCRWPPRLPDQPIFYPVLNRAYAERIARDWNIPASGSGFVTRFAVETPFARRYPTRRVGGDGMLELWVPAGELEELNDRIVGRITVVAEL